MKTSSTFASDADALTTFLDAGTGPIIVLDPCGVLWAEFHRTQRWSRLWQAWRLAPGQTQEGDAWDVLGALSHVSAAEGTAALAAAMFPPETHTPLTRQLMACVLTFAADSGHFNGRASGLAALAGQLWADELWTALARWSKKYPCHPALQSARALLTQEGASESAGIIRNCMATYHHPHVAETFAAECGLNLSTFRLRPGQIIFLTPDIRCMENPALTDVYGFLFTALHALGALHHLNFSVIEPALAVEDASL
ncbi:hypothetical protein D3C81_200170 [compost metagenome]